MRWLALNSNKLLLLKLIKLYLNIIKKTKSQIARL